MTGLTSRPRISSRRRSPRALRSFPPIVMATWNEPDPPPDAPGGARRSHSARLDFADVDEASIRGLIRAVASSVAEGIRQNKLSSILALVALLVFLPLIGIQYDERPRYRQVILPEIEGLEARFQAAIKRSEDGPTEVWQLYHFIDAHRSARDVLEHLRTRKPVSGPGIQAHGDLILYYELVNEHLAIIRTEMSLAMDLNFLARWKEVEVELEPIYDRWSQWVSGESVSPD